MPITSTGAGQGVPARACTSGSPASRVTHAYTRYEGRFAMAQEEARAAELGIWGLSHAQQCQLADRGNGKRWSQMFVRSVILDDVYRPHATKN